MKPLINIIWIVFLIVLTSCYGISKPDQNHRVKDTNAKSSEIDILEKEISLVGSLTSELVIKKSTIDTNIANQRHEVSYWSPRTIVEGVEINFHFQNDSICQSKFEEIKLWITSQWGETRCAGSFCSWEIPSARNYIATVMLSNMSSFAQKPFLEIKILENDGRVYRK